MLGVFGWFVLFRVGRLDTGLTFLATFAGLMFIRSYVYLGWPIDHFWHTLSSGTLLLFAFFMITDPVTTPNHPKARILWSILWRTCIWAYQLVLRAFRAHLGPVFHGAHHPCI